MSKTNVIAVSIHKGGSGKTSITANLAYALGSLGKTVLLIDTDSQMNLTHSYNLRSNKDKNFYKAFLNRESIVDHIVETEYENIDFVVGSVELAGIESQLGSMQLREFVVREILQEVKDSNVYDFIIIDTNPSLGILNTSVHYGSDKLLIPIEPTAFGVEGLEVFMNHFDTVKKMYSELGILGIVLNKIDGRRVLREPIEDVIKGVFGDYIMETRIRVDSNIENAQWDNMPLVPYLEENKKQSKSVEIFENLAKEVMRLV